MSAPRRSSITNDCQTCALKRPCDFCNFPESVMEGFMAMGHITLYPANATLLKEGQVPRGVYIACSGRSKSVQARDGKTIILKIAGDRQVLGMSAVISGVPSLITVTTIELCQIKFVECESFLRLIAHDSKAAMACAPMLAREVTTSFDDVHDLLLARSSTEKLARLLLSWVAGEPRNRELRVTTEFTHGEISQMIGSSRETVNSLTERKEAEGFDSVGGHDSGDSRIALQAIAS